MSRRARRRYALVWLSRNSYPRRPSHHSPSPKPTHRSLLKNLLTRPPQTVRDIPTRSARAACSRSIPLNTGASATCNIQNSLADKEVVLTFDDGPILPYSNQILDILASQCVKATYFLVGEMARAFPATVRRIYEEGHTIGTHSEHHPTRFGQLPIERMRHEIDRGISDVSAALGDPKYLAPFFRIPGLARSRLVESELAARELSVFSSDTDADDWHHRISGQQIIALVMRRLEGRGKGILLLHDIHPATVAALPGLLKALKDNGFRIVQVVPAAPYVIAMANKPKARSLASTLPGEAMIGDDGNRGAHPRWPHVVGLTSDIAKSSRFVSFSLRATRNLSLAKN